MRIRLATSRDAAAISRLVSELTLQFISVEFSPEGRKTLLASMTVKKVESYLHGGHVFHVAEAAEHIVGVAAIRGARHLYYLYVDVAHQRQGLARQLWEVARTQALAVPAVGSFTVNASRYAEPVYQRLGFQRSGAPTEYNGVTSIPMLWVGARS